MPEHAPAGRAFSRRAFLGRAGVLAAGVAVGIPSAPGTSWAAGRPSALGAEVAAFGPEAPHAWLRELYRLVKDEGYVPEGQPNPYPPGFTPTSAARFYGYVGIAMYEAVVAGMPDHKSLQGSLRGMPHMPKPHPHDILDWPTALSAAASAVAGPLLTKAASTDAVEAFHDEQVAARRRAGVPSRMLDASVVHGRAVARALQPWIDRDGYREIRARAAATPFVPPSGPGLWTSTPPNFGPAIEPFWGDIRPLVLHRSDEVMPEPHIPFSTAPGSAFHEQAMHTYTADPRRPVNEEHQGIARFWTDNPRQSGLPSGHWMLTVGQFAAQRGFGLDRAVEATARTGIALAEAFLSCWTIKYTVNLLRPVTYVREHGIDATWLSFVNTPQFPEYTSGHSVSSLAAGLVLTDIFGSAGYTDRHDLATIERQEWATRSHTSFMAAAEQAAQSRIYGGIHFPMGVEVGKDQGRAVGQLVLQRVKTRKGR